MRSRGPGIARLAAVALLGLAAAAPVCSAEIVFLTSGRTMSIKSHRVEGDSLVLALRAGGEITCPASMVERIGPDEVYHPEEPAPSAALPPVPYGDLIHDAATRAGVDPLLVRAVIQVESAYQPTARSPKGAMGLMQLMPATARRYSVRDPYDPTSNIEAGTRHLKTLLDRFELSLALAAYNAGEAAVERFRGIPPYRETQDYVRQVLRLAGQAVKR
jgi:soluble lytic murein transglycosylase-like protein